MYASELCCQVGELLEEVSRQRGIRQSMAEINWIISETLQLQDAKPSAVVADCVPARCKSGNALGDEGCPGDSWQQEDGSCSTQKHAAMAYVQRPHC